MMWTCGLNCHFTSAIHDVLNQTPESTNSQPNLSDDILCMMEAMIHRWPMHKASPLLLVLTHRLTTREEQVCPRDTKTPTERRSIMSESQTEWSLYGNMVDNFSRLVGEILGKAGKSFALLHKSKKHLSLLEKFQCWDRGLGDHCSRDATVPLPQHWLCYMLLSIILWEA